MRKLKLTLVSVCLLVMCFVLFIYLTLERMVALDKVVPTVELINQQEFLAIFHVGAVKFIPLEFNFDTNRLEYDYETTYTSAADLFVVSDTAAKNTGWIVEECNTNIRRYSKLLRFNEYYQVEEIVTMTFFPQSRRVKIVNNRGRWVPPIGTHTTSKQ